MFHIIVIYYCNLSVLLLERKFPESEIERMHIIVHRKMKPRN